MTVWGCRWGHIITRERIASCPWCGALWCLDHAEERNMVCDECFTMMDQDKHHGWFTWTGRAKQRYYANMIVHSDTDIPSVHVPENKDRIVKL